MPFVWSGEVKRAAWWVERLHPFAQDVGSVLPDGFAAYARVFHPVQAGGEQRTWRDVASANGRIFHPEAQLHVISRPVGVAAPPRFDPNSRGDSAWGTLPRSELDVLANLLSEHTSTPEACWCCIWEGYGQLADLEEIASGALPRIAIPQRAYYLLRGRLDELGELHEVLGNQSPNIWWPNDRAWCVATEVDFAWTYVGGSNPAIAAILDDRLLEALPASPSDHFTYDSDVINAELDG